MKHYSIDEWNEFVNGNIDENKKIEMLEHTNKCQECLDIYLSFIEKDLNEPPSDFSSAVIERINKEDRKLENLKKRNSFINLMIFYASAACITLFLISNGGFNAIFDFTSKSSKLMSIHPKSTNFLIDGWTDILAEKTSDFINNIIK